MSLLVLSLFPGPGRPGQGAAQPGNSMATGPLPWAVFRCDRLAVVGLLFRPGAPSPVVQEILDAAPAVGDTAVNGFALNARGYVPNELGYYRYDGSKTTPPCDEPVDWYVVREPMSISPEQVTKLLALGGGPNNRPVQPTGNRVITTR